LDVEYPIYATAGLLFLANQKHFRSRVLRLDYRVMDKVVADGVAIEHNAQLGALSWQPIWSTTLLATL